MTWRGAFPPSNVYSEGGELPDYTGVTACRASRPLHGNSIPSAIVRTAYQKKGGGILKQSNLTISHIGQVLLCVVGSNCTSRILRECRFGKAHSRQSSANGRRLLEVNGNSMSGRFRAEILFSRWIVHEACRGCGTNITI